MAAADDGTGPGLVDPQRRMRDERFADLINYALKRLGAERGAMLGAQNALAQAMGISSTMLHRYRHAGADFDALKARTVYQLAKVLDFDVTTIFLWVDQGRDAALQHQRSISQKPVAFSPVELAQELVRLLQRYGTTLDEAGEALPPQLQCQALMDAVRQKREPSPELFDQFVGILNLAPVLQEIESGTAIGLDEEQWEGLSKLLCRSSSQLQEQYLA